MCAREMDFLQVLFEFSKIIKATTNTKRTTKHVIIEYKCFGGGREVYRNRLAKLVFEVYFRLWSNRRRIKLTTIPTHFQKG